VFKKLVLITTIGYIIALATVSLIRLNNLPDVGVSFGDKIFHFLAYAILTLLCFATLSLTFSLEKTRAILIAGIFAIIFGTIIEVLQDTMTDFRALDVYDVLANSLGALLTSVILFSKNRLRVKNT
jgi:VanZ family protein